MMLLSRDTATGRYRVLCNCGEIFLAARATKIIRHNECKAKVVTHGKWLFKVTNVKPSQ